MENKTWLDALYYHPRRDEFLKNYVSVYNPGNDIEIKEVVLTTNQNGENILDITYTTLYYFTQLLPPQIAHCDKSDKPLEIHLILGEYFACEKGKNIVKATAHVTGDMKKTIGHYFRHTIDYPPTFFFNALGRFFEGRSEHYLFKAIEKLNDGVIINNETYAEMLKRKCEPIMKKMIEEDPSKKERYETFWTRFFKDEFYHPIGDFFKMKEIFPEIKTKTYK